MEHLFETIQNMSTGERLFFRRNIPDKKQPLYILVYDAIIKSTTNNPTLLNQTISKICQGKENYTKHQLHEKLLLSNAFFDASANQQISILHEIAIIKSLRFKHQIQLANKKWQKLFDKCLQMEQPAYIEILLQEKFRIELFDNHQLKIKDHQTLLGYASAHALDFSKLLELRVIYNELMFIRKRSFILFDENHHRFNEVKKNLTQITPPIKIQQHEYFFLYKTAWAIVYFLEGAFQKTFDELQPIYKKIKEPISFLQNNNEFLLDFIKFYSDTAFFIKDYKAVEAILKSSHQIFMANAMYLRHRDILHFLIKNRLYSTTTQYAKVDNLLKINEGEVPGWLQKSTEETRTILNASLAISYFIANNFNEALYFASNLIKTFTKSTRQEVMPFAYIFEAVIAFEINHFITFESKVKNAVAFFYRYPEHKEIGLEILSALQAAFSKPDFVTRKKIFQNTLKSLRISEHNISKRVIYNYFDFPAWFESKVHRMNYQDYRKKLMTSAAE